MKKYLKYGIGVILLFVLGYNSVYIKPLDEVKSDLADAFDAVEFSQKLWKEKMPARIDSAAELVQLMSVVTTNADEAFGKYTNAIAIGNYRYAMVRMQGTVDSVNEDEVLVHMAVVDSTIRFRIATEFIYGNAVRDASGLIDVKAFPVSNDLNAISEAFNQIVRQVVIAPAKASMQVGRQVEVTGAIELNKAHIHWDGLEIIPVRIQVK